MTRHSYFRCPVAGCETVIRLDGASGNRRRDDHVATHDPWTDTDTARIALLRSQDATLAPGERRELRVLRLRETVAARRLARS